MKTVVLGNPPPELESFIAKRIALGQDLHDEIWEGAYHVAPAPHAHHGIVEVELLNALAPAAQRVGLRATGAFNLGSDADDFRVPDGGYHRTVPDGVWIATAAIVVEVLSPHDETFEKFGFYARHRVDEIVVADPIEHRVRWFVLDGSGYVEVGASGLLGVSAPR